MTNRRDDWGCRGGNGTQHAFSIEGTKIITRAAATRQEEDADGVRATAAPLLYGAGVNACDRLRDLFGGAGTLHRGMHNDESSKWSLAAQHPQHVVQHGTRSGGDQANAARRVWDLALASDVKETLGLQLAL
jgi:hypothetical protein